MLPPKKILNGKKITKKQLQNCPKQLYWPNFEQTGIEPGTSWAQYSVQMAIWTVVFNRCLKISLVLLQEQFNFFKKHRFYFAW